MLWLEPRLCVSSKEEWHCLILIVFVVNLMIQLGRYVVSRVMAH